MSLTSAAISESCVKAPLVSSVAFDFGSGSLSVSTVSHGHTAQLDAGNSIETSRLVENAGLGSLEAK